MSPPPVSLPKIPKDKALHFGFSALAVVVSSRFIGLGYGVLLVSSIGLAKEVVWDGLLGNGTPDVWDFVMDVFGVILGTAIVILTRRGKLKGGGLEEDLELSEENE